MLVNMIRKLAIGVVYPHRQSSDSFIRYLKKCGVKIGANTYFFHPTNTKIDINRASYITIGSGCSITSGVSILCHDFSWTVLRKSHHEFFPDSGKTVEIGDNVFVGWDAIIIGPVKVGSNVIIGAHSVVTRDIPDNVVVAGSPAKILCTLDEYYEKKQKNRVNDAIFRAKHIVETCSRMPTKEDMGWFNVLWLDRNRESEAFLRTLSFKADNMDEVIKNFYDTEKIFDSYEQFLDNSGINV